MFNSKSNAIRGIIYSELDNKVIEKSVTGFSNLCDEIPNQFDTKFASASAGKVFVAVTILQLIETHKLKFDDTIGMLLDEIDFEAIDPMITVEQLLTHTSGIPDYFDESILSDYEELWVDIPNYRIRRNRDLFPLFIHKPMMYARGERFQYNNTGYIVLAEIVERLTQKPFDQVIQSSIFDVCAMSDSGYYALDRLPSRTANNYIFDEESQSYRTNIYSVDAKGTGAGGAFITVPDITSFWKYLISYELLSEDMTNQMLRRQSGSERDGFYGYGVWLKPLLDGSFIPYFQGQDPGVSFISMCNRKNGYIAVLVSNYGDNVWKRLKEMNQGFID